ncbi:uncharacterized protein LOC124453580 isoform X2 [Xenia sp. Carnegie-2017]|uniref:uncharacterized protein LOC124453580 isoform X2 n=1 Tax=Xenia sp. Carnegie-2017 TaxID=2897299 RepID=UPI001F042E17|nr:uncharacterized protein LOC124453580 isoform X2 [Xenia sp. Carnegie-2017]
MADNKNDISRRLTEAIGRVIMQTLGTREASTADDIPSQNSSNSSSITVQPVQQRIPAQTYLETSNSSCHLSVTRQLPSLFGGVTGGKKRKRSSACLPKRGKVYTKDVVCLPPTDQTFNIPIPRGNKRAHLAEMGLIGKVSINSAWGAEEVAKEISSVFSRAFNLQPGEVLSYDYLGYVIHEYKVFALLIVVILLLS